MPHDHAPSRIETAPATWAAVEELFGTKGEPSRCWCRWFALSAKDWTGSSPGDRKELLKSAFQTGPAPGVLAFRDGHPVGWCAVEPRQNYPPHILAFHGCRLSRSVRISSRPASCAAPQTVTRFSRPDRRLRQRQDERSLSRDSYRVFAVGGASAVC